MNKNKQEQEKSNDAEMKSSLEWIFDNGKAVLDDPGSSEIESLGKCMGIDNLWGSSGEGLAYLYNTTAILLFAKPFLLDGNMQGFLDACKKPTNLK